MGNSNCDYENMNIFVLNLRCNIMLFIIHLITFKLNVPIYVGIRYFNIL